MHGQLDRTKRNISMKSIPVLTRDYKSHSSPNSDESATSASDCFTASSLVSSTSNSSINSAVSRSYPSTTTERKNRLVPPPASGSPEWYIKKVHEQTVSSKQLTALQTSLQGKDVEYVSLSTGYDPWMFSNSYLFHQMDSTFRRIGGHVCPCKMALPLKSQNL